MESSHNNHGGGTSLGNPSPVLSLVCLPPCKPPRRAFHSAAAAAAAAASSRAAADATAAAAAASAEPPASGGGFWALSAVAEAWRRGGLGRGRSSSSSEADDLGCRRPSTGASGTAVAAAARCGAVASSPSAAAAIEGAATRRPPAGRPVGETDVAADEDVEDVDDGEDDDGDNVAVAVEGGATWVACRNLPSNCSVLLLCAANHSRGDPSIFPATSGSEATAEESAALDGLAASSACGTPAGSSKAGALLPVGDEEEEERDACACALFGAATAAASMPPARTSLGEAARCFSSLAEAAAMEKRRSKSSTFTRAPWTCAREEGEPSMVFSPSAAAASSSSSSSSSPPPASPALGPAPPRARRLSGGGGVDGAGAESPSGKAGQETCVA
mmetsp:Transcript_135151/g.341932  ORF Transcript_135151/g.341932 Transcript_135151/m.341932 type:complete len:388 (-) Transcript_135151:468-1631(-)